MSEVTNGNLEQSNIPEPKAGYKIDEASWQIANPDHATTCEDSVGHIEIKKNGQKISRWMGVDGSGGSIPSSDPQRSEKVQQVAQRMGEAVNDTSLVSPTDVLMKAEEFGRQMPGYGTAIVADVNQETGDVALAHAGDFVALKWAEVPYESKRLYEQSGPGNFQQLTQQHNMAEVLRRQGQGNTQSLEGTESASIYRAVGDERGTPLTQDKIATTNTTLNENEYLILMSDGGRLGDLLTDNSEYQQDANQIMSELRTGNITKQEASKRFAEAAHKQAEKVGNDFDDVSVVIIGRDKEEVQVPPAPQAEAEDGVATEPTPDQAGDEEAEDQEAENPAEPPAPELTGGLKAQQELYDAFVRNGRKPVELGGEKLPSLYDRQTKERVDRVFENLERDGQEKNTMNVVRRLHGGSELEETMDAFLDPKTKISPERRRDLENRALQELLNLRAVEFLLNPPSGVTVEGIPEELKGKLNEFVVVQRHAVHLGGELFTADLGKRRSELTNELNRLHERRDKLYSELLRQDKLLSEVKVTYAEPDKWKIRETGTPTPPITPEATSTSPEETVVVSKKVELRQGFAVENMDGMFGDVSAELDKGESVYVELDDPWIGELTKRAIPPIENPNGVKMGVFRVGAEAHGPAVKLNFNATASKERRVLGVRIGGPQWGMSGEFGLSNATEGEGIVVTGIKTNPERMYGGELSNFVGSYLGDRGLEEQYRRLIREKLGEKAKDANFRITEDGKLRIDFIVAPKAVETPAAAVPPTTTEPVTPEQVQPEPPATSETEEVLETTTDVTAGETQAETDQVAEVEAKSDFIKMIEEIVAQEEETEDPDKISVRWLGPAYRALQEVYPDQGELEQKVREMIFSAKAEAKKILKERNVDEEIAFNKAIEEIVLPKYPELKKSLKNEADKELERQASEQEKKGNLRGGVIPAESRMLANLLQLVGEEPPVEGKEEVGEVEVTTAIPKEDEKTEEKPLSELTGEKLLTKFAEKFKQFAEKSKAYKENKKDFAVTAELNEASDNFIPVLLERYNRLTSRFDSIARFSDDENYKKLKNVLERQRNLFDKASSAPGKMLPINTFYANYIDFEKRIEEIQETLRPEMADSIAYKSIDSDGKEMTWVAYINKEGKSYIDIVDEEGYLKIELKEEYESEEAAREAFNKHRERIEESAKKFSSPNQSRYEIVRFEIGDD